MSSSSNDPANRPLGEAIVGLSWKEATALNHRNLTLAAAWVHDEEDVERIFDLRNENFDEEKDFRDARSDLMRRMNVELLRVAMSVLAQDRLENDGKAIEKTYTVNELGTLLGLPGSSDAINSRLARVLRTLQEANFIRGYEARADNRKSRKGFKIQITNEGVVAQLEYLARCKRDTAVFDEEIADARLEETLLKAMETQ